MLTNSTNRITEDVAPEAAAQKVMIVNGSIEVLALLETVLDAGHYDVVLVESGDHAYSQIKRVLPNLVILCVSMDDWSSFQVLSMLKLDPQTADIPVLTHTTQFYGGADEDEDPEPSDAEMFAPKTALRMN
jgi:CheY-like chemotaxis protein